MRCDEGVRTVGRRAFLADGALLLAATAVVNGAPAKAAEEEGLLIGLATDLHHADKAPAGTRYYRETRGKLVEAVAKFRELRPAFVVELGDLIDAADSVDVEKRWLAAIDAEFAAASADRHYVLGNHCVDELTKEEFLGAVGRERSYYSFDRGGVHFVVLDACFRSDGEPYGRKNSVWTDANVPAEELEWLEADLKGALGKVVVFAHQRLDGTGPHFVKNAERVRRALEASGKVLAVFQGHSHQNDYRDVGGIHYATLAAMIEGSGPENNGYATASIRPDGSIVLTGFRRQKSYRWA